MSNEININEAENRDTNLNTSCTVAMSNELLESRNTLGFYELKILRFAFMQVLKDDLEFMEYKVPISQLASALGIASENMYREIHKLMYNIKHNDIEIGEFKKGKGGKLLGWGEFEWNENGVFTFRLSPSLKPYLLDLKEKFTVYKLGEILKLKTVYSIRLYELLADRVMGKKNEIVQVYLPLELIQVATNCIDKDTKEPKYKTGMFIKRVIEPSVKDINEKTNCYIRDTSQVKEGKKIVGFNFTLIMNREATTATVKKENKKNTGTVKKNRFMNFEQRSNDLDSDVMDKFNNLVNNLVD